MARDENTGLYLPPGYVPDRPQKIPPSGCEYCDSLLKKFEDPSICGDCGCIIWRTKVPGVYGARFVHHEGHNFITKPGGKKGHQALVEIHDKKWCMRKQLERDLSV